MINLFGSPAGRAINKITSIKLNKSDDDAKNRMKRITGGVDTITNDLLMSNSISGCGSQATGYGTTTISSIGSCSSSGFSGSGNSSNDDSRTPISTIDLRKKPMPKYTNLHTKKVKCWKFIEEDKLNNNNCKTSASNEKRRLSTGIIT